MREPFEEWWTNLPSRLPDGTEVRVWSEHSGYLDAWFEFLHIDKDDNVVVSPPFRRISKQDFAMVYRLWGDYVRGIVPRSRITAKTVNSTYIIGILRWFDEQARTPAES